MMPSRPSILFGLLLSLVLAGCGGGGGSAATSSAPAATASDSTNVGSVRIAVERGAAARPTRTVPAGTTAIRLTVLGTSVTRTAAMPPDGILFMELDNIPVGRRTIRVEALIGDVVVASGEIEVVIEAGGMASATVAVTPTGNTTPSPTPQTSPSPAASPTVSPSPSPSPSPSASPGASPSPTPTPVPLTVTSISPPAGPTTGGSTVTLHGTGFATSGAVTVSIGSSPATQVSVGSSTVLTCIVPANGVGTFDVVVTNPDRRSATVTNGYSYYANSFVVMTVGGTGNAGFSGDGGPATAATLQRPWDVVVDAGGNLTIVDNDNYRLRRIDAATGLISTIAGDGTPAASGDGGPATAATLNTVGLALGPNDDLYVMDQDTGTSRFLRRISATTGQINLVKDLTASSTKLLGLSVGASGKVYMAHWFGPAQLFKLDSGVMTSLTSGLSAARSVAINPTETQAYVSNQNGFDIPTEGHKVKRFDLTNNTLFDFAGTGVNGFSGDGGPAALAQLDTPWFVCTDPDGNVYISDRGNNRIRCVKAATGNIETIAGDGTSVAPPAAPDPRGDGGSPLLAQVGPLGSLTYRNGDLYFSEVDSHKVRRITAAPYVASVLPPSGPAGTQVTISGSNFHPGAIVKFDGISASNVQVSGLTQLTCTVPTGITAVPAPLSVANQGTAPTVLSQAFTRVP